MIAATRRRLWAAGYVMRESTLDARDYGLPQCRPRVFFYGVLESMKKDDLEPPRAIPPRLRLTLADVLGPR
eukprot:3941608-Alexandrium_andersonii.AAC.1